MAPRPVEDDPALAPDAVSAPSPAASTPNPSGAPTPAANDNPFEAITGKVDVAEAPNPFEEITGKVDPGSTAAGSFVRGAERSLLPTVLSMPAVAAGAEAGAIAGGFGGPLAPFTVPAGALLGGVAGALGGGYVVSKVQDYALSKLPTSWLEAIGQDERQQKLDAELHGTAAFLGGVVPMALTMRFGRIPKGVLPENPTAWQKLAANPLTARAFGGAVMGGIELGSEVATEGHPNWTHTAIATGEGIFFNKPTRFGQRLLNAGARPVQGLTERTQPPEATQGAPETETGPTVAEADALGVMGPGATEATFLGTEARNPQTDQAAQQTRRDEMAVLGEHRPSPDDPGVPVEVARKLDPEAFALRDELIERRDSLRQRIEELKNPSEEHLQEPVARAEALEAELKALEAEKPSHWPKQARILRAKIREARQDYTDRLEQQTAFAEGRAPDNEEVATLRRHFLATEHELWDVSRRTSAAMRSAADVTGGFVEPKVAPGEETRDTARAEAEVPHGEDVGRPGGAGRSAGVAEAPGEAASAGARPVEPVEGLPRVPVDLGPGHGVYTPGPNQRATDAARDYAERSGIEYKPPRKFAKVDKERAARIAAEFDKMKHAPDDPRVRASYDAMAKETMAQWEAVKRTGLKIEFIEPGMPDPYKKSPRLAQKDVEENNHLWVYVTDAGFGSGAEAFPNNPMLAPAGEINGRPVVLNDIFRIVHDYFGHIKDGNGFRAEGEEHAWRSHSAMYSPEARGAMTAETRGQNSWVNFGPHGEKNRTASAADTIYADQKAGLLPDWVVNEGAADQVAPSREVQRATIVSDVTKKLVAAGTEKDVAEAAGALYAAMFETRAARFEGKLGTAEELYKREGAEIRGEKSPGAIQRAKELAQELYQRVTSRETLAELKERIPGLGAVMDHLTPDEQAMVTKRNAEKLVEIFTSVPSAEEMAAVAFAGRAKRGWYENSARALQEVFGVQDAPRFVALLAATSPRVPVERNIQNAMATWVAWENAGRPNTRAGVLDALSTAMGGRASVIDAWINNSVRALTHADPHSILLSGPKVNSFSANLSGAMHAVTLDAWMANYANVDQKLFSGSEINEAGGSGRGKIKIKGPGYIAFSAAVRKAANVLSERTGEKWTPAEIQETVWSWAKTLYEKADKAGGLTHEEIANTPDFEALLVTGLYRRILEEAGYGKQLEGLERTVRSRAQADERARAARLEAGPETAGFADATFEEHLTRAAGRLDERREAGRAGELPDLTADEIAAQEFAGDLYQTARGMISITPGRVRNIITMMRDQNPSTIIHEMYHDFLEQFIRDASHEAAPPQLRDDFDTIRKWLGVHSAEDIKKKHHERFALAGEQYLREGVAPSQKLAGVFDQFKQWLQRIYETIKELAASANPKSAFKEIDNEMREVFGRMLAEHPERGVVSPEEARGPTLTEIHEADAQHTEPHEALPVADRLMAERERATAEVPPEVQNEFAKAEADIAAKSGSGAGAPEPGGEAGAGGAGRPTLGGPGGTPGAVAEGGARSAEPGAERSGGGPAPKESAGVRGGGRESPIDAVTPGPTDFLNPRRDTQFVDKAGNIRLDKIERPEEVKQVIREAAEANDDFIGDRRGVVTDQQVLDLSRALGMDFGFLQTRSIGQAFNAEQIVAARKLLVDSATNVWELMKRASTGTDEDVIAYAKAKDRHQMIQAQVSGVTAEAGRALRAFRHLAGQETALGVDQFLRSATGKTLFQLKQEAKLGAQIDSPENVSKMLSDAKKRTLGYGILEAWINGLLSGTSTFMTNQVANVMLIASTIPERAVAAGIGTVRGALGGETKGTIRMGELMAMARSPALGPALKATIDTLKTGQRVLLPGEDPRDMKYFYVPTQGEVKAPVLDETMRLRDIGSYAYAAVQGTRDAVRIAAAAVEADAPLVGWHFSQLGVIPDIAVKGVPAVPLGSLVRVPSRLSAAMDSFMRSWLYGMEKSAAGYRTASDEMLSGHAFDKRIAELRTNPTEEIVQNSRKAASQGALMDSSSRFVQLFAQLTNTPVLGFPYLKFIDPFVSIGANIIDQALLKRTPIGLLSPEIRADLAGHNGKTAQDTAMSRMLVGTGLAIFYMGLAAEGYLTGNAPSDAHERNIWEMTGKRAHSVLIGDMWHDISKLSPVGLHASIAADLWDAFQHGGAAASAYWAGKSDKADEELQAVATAFIHGITRTVLDQSFLRGPSDLMKAVQDSQRYGDSFVRNFTSGFIPFSSALGQTTRATDPYQRQVRTLVDAFKAKIPGYSQELLPKIDIWGEPVPNLSALGGRQFSAVYQSKVSQDPVNLAMHDLGVWKGPVGKSILGVELTPEQWTEFATIAGKTAKMRLDVMVRSADWQTYPNHVKRDVLNKYIKAARDSARGYMMMKYPSIPAEAGENKRLQHTDEED